MPRTKKRSPRVSDVPEKARRLLELKNVGPATALDLVRLGIFQPEKLAGRDPDALYEKLCKIDGVRHDPCVRYVFASLVDCANGAPARAWWDYAPKRKRPQVGRVSSPPFSLLRNRRR